MADEIVLLQLLRQVEEANARAIQRERRMQPARNINNPFEMPDGLFVAHHRLPKHLVLDICHDVRRVLAAPSRRSALSVEDRVLTALRFYATGSYQRIIGAANHMSQKAVSRCIRTVTPAIINCLSYEWVKFPMTDEDRLQVKRGFMERCGMPGVIGAIDGTHIAIIGPAEGDIEFPEHVYVNRKGYHSVNFQLVCDSKLRILSCNARFPGSTHDSFIWKNSLLRTLLEDEHVNRDPHKEWLLGDSGYPLEPWLMTPCVNPAPGSPEERFNRRLCSGRNAVERCIGVLKARFRCLLKHRVLNYHPTMAAKVINACVILHNICMHHNLPLDDNDDVDLQDEVFDAVPLDPVDPQARGNRLTAEGTRIRNRIIRFLN